MIPIIDGRFLRDRLGKGRERSSKIIILAMILVAVLMVGAIVGLVVQIASDEETHPFETSVRVPAASLYTTHSPISIVGNVGFTNASGVVWGSGTIADPYIIADWDISASSAVGIWIQHTDAHFIVRNCQVRYGYSLGPTYDGIQLYSCVNGTLENNTCSDNFSGIYLDTSSNNVLINNTCSSNRGCGVRLYSSSNNTLVNNTCSSNSPAGIVLTGSSNNTLINNNCSSNVQDGISLGLSNNNTLINNTCNSNFYGGMYLYSSSNSNTLSNNTCNSNRIYGIFLYSASNNTLSKNNCSSNDYVGMAIYLSSNNTLSKNNCSSNGNDGMNLGKDPLSTGSSDNNEITHNLVFNNAAYGVNISFGSNNCIWNNTIIGNNRATGAYDASHVQACDNGTNNWWNSTDGYGNYWSDWTTPDVAPPFGIVDQPYDIAGNASAKDYYPLTTTQTPIPEFGMMPLFVIALMAMIVLAGEARRDRKP